MVKYSRCVTDKCDNDMQYPELYEKWSKTDEDRIMHNYQKMEL